LDLTETLLFEYEGLFKDLDGNLVQLEDYKGKVVFINFWASWCRPCRSEMPYISGLYEKLKETEGIEFLLINLDSEFEEAKNYLSGKGYKIPVIYSPNELVGSLKPNSLPTTMVVNPDGKIIFYQEGMSNFDTQEFRDLLIHKIKN
jgi:thiol-disulfide isomerase/thioredoxin